VAPQAHCQRANCHRERPGMPTSGRRRCRKPGGSQCGGLRFWHPVCCSVVLCLWISVCFDRLVFALGGSSPLAPLPLLSVLWQGRSRDRRRRGVEGPRGTVDGSKRECAAQSSLPSFFKTSAPLGFWEDLRDAGKPPPQAACRFCGERGDTETLQLSGETPRDLGTSDCLSALKSITNPWKMKLLQTVASQDASSVTTTPPKPRAFCAWHNGKCVTY